MTAAQTMALLTTIRRALLMIVRCIEGLEKELRQH